MMAQDERVVKAMTQVSAFEGALEKASSGLADLAAKARVAADSGPADPNNGSRTQSIPARTTQ
jgi:hypothetical protein